MRLVRVTNKVRILIAKKSAPLLMAAHPPATGDLLPPGCALEIRTARTKKREFWMSARKKLGRLLCTKSACARPGGRQEEDAESNGDPWKWRTMSSKLGEDCVKCGLMPPQFFANTLVGC